MYNQSSHNPTNRHRTIVIAGNKTRDLLSLSLMLERFGYTVSTAHTAAQALELVADARPALVISDVVLPDKGGLDLFHLLHQDKDKHPIPVIFMISVSDAAAESRCLAYGAVGCITKPIQAEELYRAVQSAIEPRPRTTIRIDARLPVSVNNVPVDFPEGEDAVGLSEHGMYVPMNKPYTRYRRVNVTLHLKDQAISAVGAVLYSHSAGAGPHRTPGMGLKFTTITPQDQKLIRSFIHDEVTREVNEALSRASSGIR